MKYQITYSTDGQFIGLIIDIAEPLPIVLNGAAFEPVQQVTMADGMIQLSNSNYVIQAVKVEDNG